MRSPAWLGDQPLSDRSREAYLAATAFATWLKHRDAGPGDAFVAPRARDLAAREYKLHVKVARVSASGRHAAMAHRGVP